MPQDTIHAHAVVDPNAVYSLGSSPGESQRLKRQADELALESETLLDRVRLRPGDSAIDLGCGPRGIIELLHDRVSPRGRVVGLDSDRAHVAMASELVASAGLDDVEVVQADARCTALPAGSFDLVHARTLLATVPQPRQVLAEMVRLTRPGGWVASLEPDAEHSIYYPHHKAFDQLRELFVVAFPRNGADRLSAADWASYTVRPALRMSASRRERPCIHLDTPDAPSPRTCSARCDRNSSPSERPTKPNSTHWTPRSASISTTPTWS
ncbi:MAG: methyltransferase domain-containing protein [Solirubrobacterales bacterium]|nr:methyltransferase domain-containing protein [Solirubrobacterales bacterium]